MAMTQPALALSGGSLQIVSTALDEGPANHHSSSPDVSSDGRYIAFDSLASNLISGDTNSYQDVFVYDRQTGITERISIASDGTQANHASRYPSISGDGRYVAFASEASNLVSGDTNGYQDIFIHDRQTGTTERVSVASNGTQANQGSFSPAISDDGRFIAFSSSASNLVSNDYNGFQDVYIHDRQTGTTEQVSVAYDGTQTNNSSGEPSISGDGRYVAFPSYASNLVSGDTNSYQDVFVYDCQTGTTERVSVASDGTQANATSDTSTVSNDGRYVAFGSNASNLVTDDTNGYEDIFFVDRWAPYFLPLVIK
jgi:Tol biopolymer transport system component